MSAEKRVKPESLDFFLAAISPVFIIGMIGSLVFFLITVFYQGSQGSHSERLMWILGLYTLAAVLIARIAIEQSRQLAFTYMFALAAATLIVTPQLFVVKGAMAVFSFPILILLLSTVAYLADRITFDCTSMNEQQQSSGVGLLQSLGLVKSERKVASQQKITQVESDVTDAKKKSSLKRKHNPGVWVLYFSLLALPMFGLGQLAIKSPVDRLWAFRYLFFYLLSSLFLLVLISLLSLRKYLRERGVPMEMSFAIRWMAIGMTSVFAVLLVLSLLPIPGQSILSMELPFRIASRDDLKANPWGWGREGVKGQGPEQGKGEPNDNRGGDQDGKGPDEGGKQEGKQKEGKPGDNAKDGKKPNNPNQQENNQGNDSEDKSQAKGEQAQSRNEDSKTKENPDRNSGRRPDNPKQREDAQQPPANNDAKNDRRQNQEKRQQQEQQQQERQQNQQQENQQQRNRADQLKEPNQAEQQPPQPPQPNVSIQWDWAGLLQWLMMIALAIAAIVYGIIYRRELLTAVKNFLDWIRMLMGGKKKLPPPKVHAVEEATLLEDLYPPFHTFTNPFRKGSGLTHEQAVRHMYRAMLSWGYEHRIVRREDETPEEFMRRLFRRFPEQQESFSSLGMLYNRIAYARGKVTTAEVQPLADFWTWLEQKTVSIVT